MKKKFNISNIAIKAGSVAGGVVVAKIADKPLANMKPALRGALKILVGAVLPELIPAPKGAGKVNFADGLGNGILAAGVADVYATMTGEAETPPVEGIDSDLEEEIWIESEDMNGLEDGPISGENESPIADDFNEVNDDFEEA